MSLSPEEIEVMRGWSRAASAAWWKRALWGRDVYDPRLRAWRGLRALSVVCALVTAFVPYPEGRIGIFVFAAIGLAAIVVRWRALS